MTTFKTFIQLLQGGTWTSSKKADIIRQGIEKNSTLTAINYLCGRIDAFTKDNHLDENEIKALNAWFINSKNNKPQNEWLLNRFIKSSSPEEYLKNNKIETFALCPIDDPNYPQVIGNPRINEPASLIKLFALAMLEKQKIDLDENLILNSDMSDCEDESTTSEKYITVKDCVEAIGLHSSNVAFNKLVYHIAAKAYKQANPSSNQVISPTQAKQEFNNLLSREGFQGTTINNYLSQSIDGENNKITNKTVVSDLLRAMQRVCKNPQISQFISQNEIDPSCKFEYDDLKSTHNKIGSNSKVFGNIAVIEKKGQKYIALIVDENYQNENDANGQKKADNINNNNSTNCFLAQAFETLSNSLI